jgi:hypothetical protein
VVDALLLLLFVVENGALQLLLERILSFFLSISGSIPAKYTNTPSENETLIFMIITVPLPPLLLLPPPPVVTDDNDASRDFAAEDNNNDDAAATTGTHRCIIIIVEDDDDDDRRCGLVPGLHLPHPSTITV